MARVYNGMNSYSGTWTPKIRDGSGNYGSFSSYTNCNFYVKGNYVTVHGTINNINTTGMVGTDNLYIEGLPLSGKYTIKYDFVGVTRSDYLTKLEESSLGFGCRPSGQALVITEILNGSISPYVNVNQFLSGSADISFSCSYIIGE
jgi:hypothetical protein